MLLCGFLTAGTGIAHAPDRVRAVITDKQGAILSEGDANMLAPDVSVVEHEAGQEIFVLTAGAPLLMQGNANDFIAGAYRAIPGTMSRGKNVPRKTGRNWRPA